MTESISFLPAAHRDVPVTSFDPSDRERSRTSRRRDPYRYRTGSPVLAPRAGPANRYDRGTEAGFPGKRAGRARDVRPASLNATAPTKGASNAKSDAYWTEVGPHQLASNADQTKVGPHQLACNA